MGDVLTVKEFGTMRARFSQSVIFFKDKFMQRYGLTEGGAGPVAMFGIYRPEDFEFYKSYKYPITVLWCGTDGLKLTPSKARIIKSKRARHIVSSKFNHDRLRIHGIKHEVIPFTPAIPDLPLVKRGDCVYHYGSSLNDFYKTSWLDEIRQRTGLKVISATKDTYSKDELVDVYGQCFIGLRLTDHDGLPTTVVELGMMGRRSIHNGSCPHVIPYKGIDDVCEIIMEEYKNKDEDNKHIRDDWQQFLNVSWK